MISTGVEKHLKYFEYMGLTKAKHMTQQDYKDLRQYLEDKDIHLNDWLMNQLGVDSTDKSRISFNAKQSQWHSKDKYILYPELFKDNFKSIIETELPDELATFVRSKFTGSSDKITKDKIKEVINHTLKENPQWFFDDDRNNYFLVQFSKLYPRCCDGVNPSDKRRIQKQSSNHNSQQARSPAKKKSKVLVTFIIIGILILILTLIW